MIRKRILSLIILLVVIHISSVIQSCDLLMRCSDPVSLEMDVMGIHTQAFSFRDGLYNQEEPLDGSLLGIWLEVELVDHVASSSGGLIAPIFAFQCEEDKIIIRQA